MSAPLKFEFKKDTGPISLAGLGPNPTAQFDVAFGSTQGSVIYRSASAWTALTPGSSGQFLTTNGAAANPSWGTGTGVLPSQTSNSGKLLTTDGTNASWTTTGVLTSLTSPAATDLTLGTGTLGAAITVLSADNNVGIGTVTPQKKLHIYDGTNGISIAQAIVQGGAGGYGAGLSFQSVLDGGALAEMARITADGEDSWNTTASTQDAGLRFFTTLNGTAAEKMRINATGNVSIAATTASSSAITGALQVAGGIGVGAASYFGGAVTISSANLILSAGYELRFGAGGVDRIYQDAASGGTLVFDAGNVTRMTLNSTAATFSGAVAIGNTTAASVAAPSTHKVSILIGGVQYYLLASNI